MPVPGELVLAVDVGGTKIGAALVALDGAVRTSVHAATPRTTDPSSVWQALVGVVRSASARAGGGRLVGCGVGCGGPMDTGGALVSPLNIPAWRDFPLRDRLAELTGLETFLDNDAKALALAEGWLGAAAGRRSYLAMVVSTGVGGGVVVDGRLLDGRTGNAGHIGHVVVEPGGRPCPCGGRGGPSAGAPPAAAPPSVVERTGTLVGRAVADAACLLDVDLAVVSGSVALGFGQPFFAAAQAELSTRARLSFCARARVVPGALGALGPLVGAAAVGLRGIRGGSWQPLVAGDQR